MDLRNNAIGMSLYEQGFTNAQLSALAWNAIITGVCRYLSPINPNTANNPTTHGITAQTQLTPTNQ